MVVMPKPFPSACSDNVDSEAVVNIHCFATFRARFDFRNHPWTYVLGSRRLMARSISTNEDGETMMDLELVSRGGLPSNLSGFYLKSSSNLYVFDHMSIRDASAGIICETCRSHCPNGLIFK